MSKIRINDLARELEVKSKEILDVLTTVGVTEKKTHSSSLEDHEAELSAKAFAGPLRSGRRDPRSLLLPALFMAKKRSRPRSTSRIFHVPATCCAPLLSKRERLMLPWRARQRSRRLRFRLQKGLLRQKPSRHNLRKRLQRLLRFPRLQFLRRPHRGW